MTAVVAALSGLVIGSFLNVVIHRVPLRKSIVWRSSKCPSCGEGIKSFDNLPIISYLILRGRCRNCKIRISPRYPLVEALTGLLFGLAAYEFRLSLSLLWALVLISVLVCSPGPISSSDCCRTRSWFQQRSSGSPCRWPATAVGGGSTWSRLSVLRRVSLRSLWPIRAG